MKRFYRCVEYDSIHEFEDAQLMGRTPEDVITEWRENTKTKIFAYTYELLPEIYTPKLPGMMDYHFQELG